MKTYQHAVVVHWGDTDPAKIVFYPNYFVWFDESTRMYFDSVGLNWDNLMDQYNAVGFPIVDAHARLLAPSMFRDEIVVETSIGKWNEKTFVVNHVIYNKGKKCVEGEETRVWALRHPDDPTRLKAGIIPPEIIKAFE
jgi:4-hydroxybenzoyl-CoA thioesterase